VKIDIFLSFLLIMFGSVFIPLDVNAGNCSIFPKDNPWNTKIAHLPVHPNSHAYIKSIGLKGHLHADFGTKWKGAPNGIPFVIVNSLTKMQKVNFEYSDESDSGPYPIPKNPPIEGGPKGQGDRHIIMINYESCILYELYDTWPPGTKPGKDKSKWFAGSGAIFNLSSNKLRPEGWTSADAAGLPIFPGLVKYEEVKKGSINHALRFTVQASQKAYIHPATHFASNKKDPDLPPMGLRLRLKADFKISRFSREAQIILQALKTYGMFLADNGSNWYISGEPNEKWDNDLLHELQAVPGSAFEAVDTGEKIHY